MQTRTRREERVPSRWLTTWKAMAFSAAVACMGLGRINAQEGTGIKGTVTAAESGAPLERVRVSIARPAREAATNHQGMFSLRNLPPGTYDLLATAVGRAPSHHAVTLTAGHVETLNISLSPGSLMLSAIVVTATKRATVRAAYESRSIGTWTGIGRYEGNAILSSALTLPAFTVVDLNVSRRLLNDIGGFVAVENLFDREYDVSLSGSAAAPLVSLGTPRTLRIGLDVTHF